MRAFRDSGLALSSRKGTANAMRVAARRTRFIGPEKLCDTVRWSGFTQASFA